MPTILVVDDSATDRGVAGGLLAKDDQNTVAYATNGREALDVVEKEHPDLVVSDLQMPEMDGLELVEAMREDYPMIPVVLMTARGSEEIAAEALRVGAAGYVPKVTLGQNLRATVGAPPGRRAGGSLALPADAFTGRQLQSLSASERSGAVRSIGVASSGTVAMLAVA